MLFGLQFGNRGFQPFCRLPWAFFGSSIWPLCPVGLYRQESMVLKLDDISTCLEGLDGLLPLLFALQGQPARLSGIPGFSTRLHRNQISSIWTIWGISLSIENIWTLSSITLLLDSRFSLAISVFYGLQLAYMELLPLAQAFRFSLYKFLVPQIVFFRLHGLSTFA